MYPLINQPSEVVSSQDEQTAALGQGDAGEELISEPPATGGTHLLPAIGEASLHFDGVGRELGGRV